jgi:hypothetical protein
MRTSSSIVLRKAGLKGWSIIRFSLPEIIASKLPDLASPDRCHTHDPHPKKAIAAMYFAGTSAETDARRSIAGRASLTGRITGFATFLGDQARTAHRSRPARPADTTGRQPEKNKWRRSMRGIQV